MAKKKTNDEAVELNDSEKDKLLDKALSDLNDINPDASFLDESALSNVTDWIDTSCYALNAIISGSLFGGIAVGRVSGFVGPNSTGKTLIMNQIMANAIKKGYKPIYFDSENALDRITAHRLGCDVSKIKHVPIEFIEDCKHQLTVLLTKMIDANIKKKAIIFIDSLGGLKTKKEYEDAMEGSSATDMGSRAKHITSLINIATSRAAKAEVPIVFSNHIYENPGQMHPTMIKTSSGGLKPLYLASLLVQLSTTGEKIEKAKGDKVLASKLSTNLSGVNIRALTTKNRFVIPFLETSMELNYKSGLHKYSGLLDMAVAYGLITREGARCSMGAEKLGYASSFELDPNFWEGDMLKRLDAEIKKDLSYSNANDSIVSEVDKLT